MISARQHPLRVYAALELGIGVLALLILFGMPLVGGVYTAWAGEGIVGRHRPARDRGGHLPAAADDADGRHAAGDLALGEGDARRRVVARVLLRRQHRRRRDRQPAGRLLSAARLRRATATFVAVAINAGVALVAYVLAGQTHYQAEPVAVRGGAAGARTVGTSRSRCRA